MGRVEERIQKRDGAESQIQLFKSEVYDYMQSKLKQMSKTYSSKFSQLEKQTESAEERIR